MTDHADKPSGQIELVAAERDQEPTVANLLELFIHDFSEFHDVAVGSDGRFGYRDLPLYWSDPDRHPFLVQMDGKLAGLVFVRLAQNASDNEMVWDMAEFFILRGYRRRGIGAMAAQVVWNHFPGRWQVRVMETNVAAQKFWARTISTFLGEVADPAHVERGSRRWQVFSFDSRQPGQ